MNSDITNEQKEAIREAEAALRCLDASWQERAEAAQKLVESFGLPFELYDPEESCSL